LPNLADQGGLPGDGGAPLPAVCLVGAQGGYWLALVREAPGQDEGILPDHLPPETGGAVFDANR